MGKSQRDRDYTTVSLLFIIAISALLRLLFLDSIPQGFNCDEAADGYEAYSVLETWRDRYGKFLPAFFKTLGNDYREAPFTYLIIPSIKIFGLNEFATRFPAALSSILTVLALFYLVKECFSKRVALLAALFLAINPWSIYYSRITFRVNLLPLFFCLALLFFLKSFRNSKHLFFSGLLFVLSFWTYSSARVFVSLFLIGLIIIFRKHLWKNKQQTLITFFVFLPFFLVLLKFWISPEGMTRAKATGLEINPIVVIQDYLSYYSPAFLFFRGEQDFSLNPANLGCLYYFEIVTVIVGIFRLIREDRKERAILFLWLLLYPLPAALVGPESSLRTLVGAPVFATFSAYGGDRLLELIGIARRKLFVVAAFFVIAVSLTIFVKRYFFEYPVEAAIHWQYGMKEAIAYAQKSSYNCVIFNSDSNSNCFAIQDFIAKVPFYTQYPPKNYQKAPIPPWIGGSRNKVYTLGKYRLMSFSNQKKLNEKCLFIIRPEEISNVAAKGYNWKEVYAVKDNRGIEHFKLIEIRKAKT
jgi:4-amino-4-deoxy-L-arabinose transferase-like glycosyltransferase